MSGRSTTQGYSHKYDFSKDTKQTPPPNSYNLSSSSFFSTQKAVSMAKKNPTRVRLIRIYNDIYSFI